MGCRPGTRWLATAANLLVCLGVVGCAINDFEFGRLPIFMGESPRYEAVPDEPNAMLQAAFGKPVAVEGISDAVRTDEAVKNAAFVGPAKEAGAPGISLDQVIAECLSTDPKLRAAAEVINQAKADLLTNSLLPNPVLTGDALLFGFHRFTPNVQGGPPQADMLVGFPIDWFLFGKRAANVASGKLGVAVSEADFADQVRQRVLSGMVAYYDVLEAKELLKVAQDNFANLQTVEKMTQERIKLGGVGTIELDRVRLALFDAQRDVRRSETALVAAKATLQTLIGRREATTNFDVAGTLGVPAPANPLPSTDAFALAEENRPDVISLRRQIAKAEADIRVERRKAYPQVTPSLGLTQQYQHQIGFPNATTFDAYLNMSLPFFDRNQGNIRKADSVLVQTRFVLESQLNDLRSEIEQAAQEFQAAHANVTSVDAKQLKAAEGVRDRIEAAYKAGGRSLLEVLDAQRAYRDTLKLYVTGQSSYWRTLHRLNGAIGKQVIR